MLVGCSLSLFGEASPVDAARSVREAGLVHVEMAIDHILDSGAKLSLPKGDPLARAWLEAIDAAGLRVAVVRFSAAAANSPPTLERATVGFEWARQLGADVVVLPGGAAFDADERSRLIQQHRRLGGEALDRGLIVALDTCPGICGDSRMMNAALADIDHPAVRLCFDTGGYLALNVAASVEVALQRVIGRIGCLRLTDHNDYDAEAWFPPLGCGCGVDFARTLQLLDAIDFSGPCMIDCRPKSRRPPTLKDRRNWLAESLEHLGQCGWPIDD